MTKICIPGQEPIGVSVTHEDEDRGRVEFSLKTVISANPETIEALKNNKIGHGIEAVNNLVKMTPKEKVILQVVEQIKAINVSTASNSQVSKMCLNLKSLLKNESGDSSDIFLNELTENSLRNIDKILEINNEDLCPSSRLAILQQINQM